MQALARRWATKLADQTGLGVDRAAVLEYAIVWVGNTVLTYLGLAVIGYVLGLFGPIVVAALSAGVLRGVSGGAHYSTPTRCALLTVGIFVALGGLASVISAVYPTTPVHALAALVAGVGLPLAWKFAPDPDPKRHMTHREAVRFRYATLFILALYATLLSGWVVALPLHLAWGLFLSVSWQLLSLTLPGHRLAQALERRLFGEGVRA